MTEAPEVVTSDEVHAFVARTVPEVYRYVIRLTGGDASLAEDLVQQTCLALVREVRAKEAFAVDAGWMVVVARRRFVDHVRHQRREAERIERVERLRPPPPAAPDWTEPDGDVLALLGRLDVDHRTALVLRYVDDLSVAEVAAHLDRSVTATKSLLARARRQLGNLMEEAGHGTG